MASSARVLADIVALREGWLPHTPMTQAKAVRRLSDNILTAFHLACDQGDFEVAARLLRVLETIITAARPSPQGERRRHDPTTLVSAHERLWHLRHQNEA